MESPTFDAEMNELTSMVLEYGNLEFDCGNWDDETSNESYDAVLARARAARDKLLSRIEELRKRF